MISSNLGGVGVGWWRREFDNKTTSPMRHLTPRFLLLWLFSSLYNGVKPERHGSGDIVESQITFTCKFRERPCNGLSKTKRAGTKETIRLPLLYPSYNNTCTLEEPQATPWANRGCLLLASTRASFYSAFLLTWPAVMQIHCNKRKFGSVKVTGKLPNHPTPSLPRSRFLDVTLPHSERGSVA